MKNRRRFIFGFTSVVLGILISLLIFELVLRLLPVTTAQYKEPVDNANPIARFKANNMVTFSAGWNMKNASYKRTNNYGFFSDTDYRKDSNLPLMVVVGDSFVEAFQVDNAETFHGLLGNAIGKTGRIYSFAMGGAPLSQYLAYANYAREEFSPNAFVFNIIYEGF